MHVSFRALALAAGALSVAGGAALSPALASPPSIDHETNVPANYTLTPADTGCPFDITVQGADDFVTQSFSNGKVMTHDDFVGTESANGVTLASTEHATITDYPDGSESWTGQPLKLSPNHGKPIIMDRGRLVYAPDGSIAFEHGPHPYLDGDPAYCAAFTP